MDNIRTKHRYRVHATRTLKDGALDERQFGVHEAVGTSQAIQFAKARNAAAVKLFGRARWRAERIEEPS